ncbi:dihydrofolate reductase [Pseudenhygromyxa sp. WMMC2535]|uniref:dihydrofolate reductase n=1 Tax=Pseudenhygromyxa sp. WMMC2535 TaxID=2712867 RepID=UPI00155242A8|nr:dihydrofolate reductase [Pseudenhygromyxa sp. WMMC2535]NVB43104.1 dihydrofolate reductase [Pseudenhygromyxa sp. WMMC2535]
MRVALIAAVSENGVIGRDQDLPWHLPDEFRHFKRTTQGHHVIMGRRTWESQGKPLPKRVNLVVTSRPDFQAPGAQIVRSLAEGLALAREAGDDEAFVIGGTRLYAEALALADRLYLTRVHAEVEGDAHFPAFDRSAWTEVERREHPADERHAHAFTIMVLERRAS